MLCSHPVHAQATFEAVDLEQQCVVLCVPPYIALYIPCDEVITMHIERLVCILAAAIFAIGCRVG